jgi:peptidoglycan/LPS O-acetylase OafA/YrhL
MDRVPELTGLRAVAIFLTFFSHTTPWLQGGWIGVDIFFVLSGYLITSILVAEWRRNERIRLGRFYAKRALRLYPALILMFAVGIIFYRYLGDGGTLVGYGKTALLGLTYNEDIALGFFGQPFGLLGHTSTLAIEEQFYLFWAPVLLLLLKFQQRPVLWLSGFIVLSSISLAITTTRFLGDVPLTYFRPDTRMNELFLGCLIAFIIARYGQALARSRPLRLMLGPIGLAGIVCIEMYSNTHGRMLTYPQQEICAGLVSGLLLIGLVIASPANPLNRLLRLRPVVWVGTISYGIYIYFIPVLGLLGVLLFGRGRKDGTFHHVMANPLVALAAQIICTLAVASLSYYLVERRFLALKDRLSDRAAHKPRAVASAGAGLSRSQDSEAAQLGGRKMMAAG